MHDPNHDGSFGNHLDYMNENASNDPKIDDAGLADELPHSAFAASGFSGGSSGLRQSVKRKRTKELAARELHLVRIWQTHTLKSLNEKLIARDLCPEPRDKSVAVARLIPHVFPSWPIDCVVRASSMRAMRSVGADSGWLRPLWRSSAVESVAGMGP